MQTTLTIMYINGRNSLRVWWRSWYLFSGGYTLYLVTQIAWTTARAYSLGGFTLFITHLDMAPKIWGIFLSTGGLTILSKTEQLVITYVARLKTPLLSIWTKVRPTYPVGCNRCHGKDNHRSEKQRQGRGAQLMVYVSHYGVWFRHYDIFVDDQCSSGSVPRANADSITLVCWIYRD